MPSRYCTTLDLRLRCKALNAAVVKDEELDGIVVDASGLFLAGVQSVYAESALLASAPWAKKGIIPWRYDQMGREAAETGNTGRGTLGNITVLSTATTELWTLKFTSTSAYTFTGSESGSQGSGSTGADSTSSNSYITVPSSAWGNKTSIQKGDEFYVPVYQYLPAVVSITSWIGVWQAMSDRYAEEIPHASEYAEKYYKKWTDALHKLCKPNDPDGMQLTAVGRDYDEWYSVHGWNPDDEGGDSTPYETTDPFGYSGIS